MSRVGEALPVAAAAFTGVQVGAAIVATRFVVDQVDPATLALLRYLIGFLALLPFALRSGPVRFRGADVLPIAILGIGQFGILIALMNIGLQYISAGRAALIFMAMPFLTMLFAAALGREALTRAKAAGVVLTMIGVAFVLGDRLQAADDADRQWIGAVAILASATVGALCSVYYRPYLIRYPTVPISALAMVSSVIFLTGAAAYEGLFAGFPVVTPVGWAAILFIGLGSAIGYFLWLWALKHISPTRVAVFLSLSPLTAALLGTLLLDEAPTWSLVIGLVFVIAGLWSAHRPDAAAGSARP